MIPNTQHLLMTKQTLILCDIEAGEVAIEAAAADSGDAEQSALKAFSMTAYTGGAMRLATMFYPVVVDLAGLKISKKSRPILRDHSPQQIVGHTTEIVNDGRTVKVRGVISAANAVAQEVVESSRNGFPWQASIGAAVEKLEFVEEKSSVEVNGKTFSGPLYVARKGVLGEVSFVALGADDNTAARVAAQHVRSALMNPFEQWLTDNQIDPAALSATALTSIKAMYTAQHPEELPPPEEPPPEEPAGELPATVKAMRHHAAAEARRLREIQAAAVNHPPILEQAITQGWTTDQTHLAVLRAERAALPGMQRTATATPLQRNMIEASFCMALNLPDVEKQYTPQVLEAAYQKRREVSLKGLIMQFAVANGYSASPGESITDGNLREILRCAFLQASGSSTLSLPGILGAVANKSLLAGYMEVDQTWREVAVIKSVQNFHTHTSYRLLDNVEYQELGENGQIKHGSLSEESYTRSADTYALMMALTRKQIINDDLSAFDELRERMGRGSSKKFNNLFWTKWLDNATFFTAGRGNFISGATTTLLTDGVGLEQGVTAFRKLKSPAADGAKRVSVGGNPSILLVPPELEHNAERLHVSTNLKGSTDGVDGNIHLNKYRPVVVPQLSDTAFTGNSATAWYLLRNPRDLAGVCVSFLNGVQTPTVESADADFNQLGIQFRGYHDFGVDLAEYLCGIKSKGAA